jgi:hypothetical protein
MYSVILNGADNTSYKIYQTTAKHTIYNTMPTIYVGKGNHVLLTEIVVKLTRDTEIASCIASSSSSRRHEIIQIWGSGGWSAWVRKPNLSKSGSDNDASMASTPNEF